MSLNKVMLIGNVGQDPNVRYLEGNAKVASFTLATTERFKDRSGQLRENTEWHNIVVWRGLADTVEKYVHKGTQLYVEGRIQSRSYDDKTGNKRYVTEIIADNVQLLGRRSDSDSAPAQAIPASGPQYSAPQTPQYQAPQYQAPKPAAPAVDDLNGGEDDLPF